MDWDKKMRIWSESKDASWGKYESFYKKSLIGKYSYLEDWSIEVKKGKENKKSVFLFWAKRLI